MAVVDWSENFDGMAEGLSPPTGFSNLGNLWNMEVDDVHYRSAPHSMRIKGQGVAGWKHGHKDIHFLRERYTLWIYIADNFGAAGLRSQSIAGTLNSGKELFFLMFTAGSWDIKYSIAGFWNDTGHNYSTGLHKIDVDHNFDTHTYDIYYDDTLIVANGAMRDAAAVSVEQVTFLAAKGVAVCEYWIDDMSVSPIFKVVDTEVIDCEVVA